MNRPYFALAALLAVISGSSLAVGPARPSATSKAAALSRTLCTAPAHGCMVAVNLFTHYGAGQDAAAKKQGSDTETSVPSYKHSCGYDPCRGEYYDAQPPAIETSFEEAAFECHDGTFAEQCEIWPTDERDYEGDLASQLGCESNDANQPCPYFGGRPWHEPVCGNYGDNFDCGEWSDLYEQSSTDELACQQAQAAWLADQEALQQVAQVDDESCFFAPEDESCFFWEQDDEAWKTKPVEMPNWIEDYVSGICDRWSCEQQWSCIPRLSIEQQYAEAEMAAAREANDWANPGSAVPSSSPPRVSEYESLYGLDTVLGYESDAPALSAESQHDAEVLRPLSRFIGGIWQVIDEVLPAVEQEADQWIDYSDEMFRQWQAISTELTIAACERADAQYEAEYASMLPEEAAESREAMYSLAEGLRTAGKFLLNVADGLEAQAESILSARTETPWAR